jgi:FkbM family methyltransferase
VIYSALGQVILDNLLKTPYGSPSYRLLLKLRQLLIALANPSVHYQLDSTDILLPLDHALPLIRKTTPLYNTNLSRIAAQVGRHYPDLHVIDIGANVGDTVIGLAGHFPVLCIEGNDLFFPLLENNTRTFKTVECVKALVGQGSVQGQMITKQGTARLQTGSGELITLRSLSDILRQYPHFAAAKLLKLDTDGMDVSILRGELTLLEHLKPILFFEYDPTVSADAFEIFADLHRIGYQVAILYENTGEYLLTTSLDQTMLLEDLHHFYARSSHRYLDICMFHQEDDELAQSISQAEREFFF